MEEGQVTVDGVSHPIPQPFIVFATQNPTGAAGTQLLPDSLEPQTKSVKTPDDLRELLNTLLQTHLTGNTPSLASRAYPHADWRYHVQPEEQEVQQA